MCRSVLKANGNAQVTANPPSFAGLDSAKSSIKSLDTWMDLEKDYGLAGFRKATDLRKTWPHLKVRIRVHILTRIIINILLRIRVILSMTKTISALNHILLVSATE